jgi:hypothetical protein
MRDKNGTAVKFLTRFTQSIHSMIQPGDLSGYFLILSFAGIIIISLFRTRHILWDLRRMKHGLSLFVTCHGKERWGPPARVKEWRRNAVRHLIAQRESLENDLWQLRNRRNNLAEMCREEQKKLSALKIAELNAKETGDLVQFRFIEFEISRNKVKFKELKDRILQKDTLIHSMEEARYRVNSCLLSYSKGENPRLPVPEYIRGLFFDLR